MLVATLLVITAVDLRFHRIHNVSIAILIFESLAMHKLHVTSFGLIFSFAFAALLFLVRAGGGDIKFAIFILGGLIPSGSNGKYLQFFLLLATIHLVIHFLITHRFSGHLPLAPALAGSLALVIM